MVFGQKTDATKTKGRGRKRDKSLRETLEFLDKKTKLDDQLLSGELDIIHTL